MTTNDAEWQHNEHTNINSPAVNQNDQQLSKRLAELTTKPNEQQNTTLVPTQPQTDESTKSVRPSVGQARITSFLPSFLPSFGRSFVRSFVCCVTSKPTTHPTNQPTNQPTNPTNQTNPNRCLCLFVRDDSD